MQNKKVGRLLQPAFAELVLQHITISDKVGKSPLPSPRVL